MRASLADQSLAIALGANLPSPAGGPIDTLVAVRPQLEALLSPWRAGLGAAEVGCGEPSGPGGDASALRCHWSPLFATAPVGGPADQPTYFNAVVVVEAPALTAPSVAAARELLQALHQLEQHYGRQRRERWGPRSLDLDLLWWGELASPSASLELPHPRWHERGFVLAPLLAIERRLGEALWCPHSVGLAAAAAEATAADALPQPLLPRHGWPD